MTPSPAFAPCHALANICALIRSRASRAGTDDAMSRIVSTRRVPSGKRISWPESGR